MLTLVTVTEMRKYQKPSYEERAHALYSPAYRSDGVATGNNMPKYILGVGFQGNFSKYMVNNTTPREEGGCRWAATHESVISTSTIQFFLLTLPETQLTLDDLLVDEMTCNCKIPHYVNPVLSSRTGTNFTPRFSTAVIGRLIACETSP